MVTSFLTPSDYGIRMLTPEHMNDDAACKQSKIGRDDIGGILSNTEIHFT